MNHHYCMSRQRCSRSEYELEQFHPRCWWACWLHTQSTNLRLQTPVDEPPIHPPKSEETKSILKFQYLFTMWCCPCNTIMPQLPDTMVQCIVTQKYGKRRNHLYECKTTFLTPMYQQICWRKIGKKIVILSQSKEDKASTLWQCDRWSHPPSPPTNSCGKCSPTCFNMRKFTWSDFTVLSCTIQPFAWLPFQFLSYSGSADKPPWRLKGH